MTHSWELSRRNKWPCPSPGQPLMVSYSQTFQHQTAGCLYLPQSQVEVEKRSLNQLLKWPVENFWWDLRAEPTRCHCPPWNGCFLGDNCISCAFILWSSPHSPLAAPEAPQDSCYSFISLQELFCWARLELILPPGKAGGVPGRDLICSAWVRLALKSW